MSKYLYGASVQGIQDFIFATNKLKEIVGASELVKQITTAFESQYKPSDVLVKAAGNIKAVFDSKEECEKAVLEFPKMIQKKAYGITISQAVVDMSNDAYKEQDKAIQRLEEILKMQRNKQALPLDSSLNIMKLNPSTAKPLVNADEDKATNQKLKAYKSIEQNESYKDLKDISNSKNKLAVIHIDGNGLGDVIKNLKTRLRDFSVNLAKATKEASQIAKKDKQVREIILGGDDVTVICNANDALAFTKEFLEHFEEQTKKNIGSKLTACAGIAYSNEKYPFHYDVALAEELCTQAKKHAKKIDAKLAPSCLMLHNIQSSNYQSWEKFVQDELTIKNDSGSIIRLDFGPYYLKQKDQALIEKLQIAVESYRCEGSPIGKLRNWLSELYKSQKYADILLERINDIVQQSGKWNCKIMDKNLENFYSGLSDKNLIIEKDGTKKTPIYDILQILSVTEAKS
jgi:hypothetical protein